MDFKIGDFILNKKPYNGESEYLVMEIDIKTREYRCAIMKGKHCEKHDFDNRELIPFEKAHQYYEKVG